MFKTRKKDIRRRPISKKATDEESEDSDASVGTAPPPPPEPAAATASVGGAGGGAEGRPKKMRKKAKAKQDKGPKPVLSFGHEDEDEGVGMGVGKAKKAEEGVFRVKKTKASKVTAWGGVGWGCLVAELMNVISRPVQWLLLKAMPCVCVWIALAYSGFPLLRALRGLEGGRHFALSVRVFDSFVR